MLYRLSQNFLRKRRLYVVPNMCNCSKRCDRYLIGDKNVVRARRYLRLRDSCSRRCAGTTGRVGSLCVDVRRQQCLVSTCEHRCRCRRPLLCRELVLRPRWRCIHRHCRWQTCRRGWSAPPRPPRCPLPVSTVTRPHPLPPQSSSHPSSHPSSQQASDNDSRIYPTCAPGAPDPVRSFSTRKNAAGFWITQTMRICTSQYRRQTLPESRTVFRAFLIVGL